MICTQVPNVPNNWCLSFFSAVIRSFWVLCFIISSCKTVVKEEIQKHKTTARLLHVSFWNLFTLPSSKRYVLMNSFIRSYGRFYTITSLLTFHMPKFEKERLLKIELMCSNGSFTWDFLIKLVVSFKTSLIKAHSYSSYLYNLATSKNNLCKFHFPLWRRLNKTLQRPSSRT